MMRRSDAFGLAGILLLLCGAFLYVTGDASRLSGIYWLGGPLLWFAGFALLVGWAVGRWGRPATGGRPSQSSASRK